MENIARNAIAKSASYALSRSSSHPETAIGTQRTGMTGIPSSRTANNRRSFFFILSLDFG